MPRPSPRIGVLALVLALAAALALAAFVVAPPGRAQSAAPHALLHDRPAAPKAASRAPASRARRAAPLGARAIGIARRYLGTPYRYGGASPSGFDCSGFVMYVYGRLGISLPHNAAALYGVGRPVPISRLRPGDLVFFSGLGHVGMAVGGGRYIHSPETGRSVEIASLASRSGSIVGARRILRAL